MTEPMEAPAETALGRVLDPRELDASAGPRGKLTIEIPESWVDDEPLDLEVTAPARLVCARCDGGGCDGCGRSGALVVGGDPSARVVRATLGPSVLAAGDAGVLVRITNPFGGAGGVDQLLLKVRLGAGPSSGVTRLEHVELEGPPSGAMDAYAARGRATLASRAPLVLAMIAALVGVILAVLRR